MTTPAPAGSPATSWPSRPAAYYGLAVIVLATMLNFFDGTVFFMMVERIRVDFQLSDVQLGWLLGPANIIFYVLVGIPLARLVDIYPRKIVLAAGLLLTSGLTALGGIVQGFKGLFATRMLAGAGGSAHAPGAYSLLADFFPPERLPRAIAVLQLGFIGGTTLGAYIGGQLLGMVAGWEPTEWRGLTIYGWQWVLIMVGAPGLLIVAALLFMREPPRQGVSGEMKSLPVRAVVHEIWLRKRVARSRQSTSSCSSSSALGSLLIGTVTQRVLGDPQELWKAMALTAAVLMPLAAFTISRGIKPYREEILRLESVEAAGAQGRGVSGR